MRTIRVSILRVLGGFRRRSVRDFNAEVSAHLQLHIDENLRQGMTPEDARRDARLKLGGIDLTTEAYRDRRGLPMLETISQDVRYALRTLRRSRGFTVIALLTLALGIGGTTAMFSIVDAVVFRPLSYREPDRLVAIHEVMPGLPPGQFSPVNALHFREWQRSGRAFERMALVFPLGFSLSSGTGEPEGIGAARVSSTFFGVIGVQPAIGRDFRSDDDTPDSHVVIISHSLWRQRFSSDPSIIGRAITLDGDPHEVVGVLPEGFTFPSVGELYSMSVPGVGQPQIWKPFAAPPGELRSFGSFNYACIARLAPGVSAAQAIAELNGVQASLRAQVPGLAYLHAELTPLHDQIGGRSRLGLELMLGAMGMVLLIACVNISSLLLTRSGSRRREVAIRSAIGATRIRLMRQMLIESLTLSGLGGVVGASLAYILIPFLVAYAPASLPRLDEVRIDMRLLVFATGLSLLTGLLVGLLPAWRFGTPATRPAAGSLTVRSPQHTGGVARAWLVGMEVAVTALCLVVGGLLLTSLARLLNVDPGFAVERVLTAAFYLPQKRYPGAADRAAFVSAAIERVRALPGVVAAGASNSTPLTGGGANGAVTLEGVDVPRPERPKADQRFVTPGYFQAIGIPLKRGRLYADGDRGRNVVVIGSSMANRLWPQKDLLGRRLAIGPDDGLLWFDVVGVVGDVRTLGLDRPSPLTIYLPPWIGVLERVSLSVRTSGLATAISGAVRQTLRDLDRELVIPPVQTMDEVVAASVAQRRFQLELILLFAGLATLLAALGIYGVVAESVRQRTNEFGIRLALGARAGQIRLLVFAQGLRPIALGLVAGIAGSLALGRFLRSLLFEVAPGDPATMGAVIAILTLACTLAMYLPARRATRVNPLQALRYE